MSPLIRISVAFLATYAAGVVGFLFVDASASSWYATLAKPPLTPSGGTIQIVWLVLYALAALSLAIIWNTKPQTPATAGWMRFYFVQLLFNAAWTMFFFGLHSLLVAFVDILVLGFVVICLIASAWEIDRRVAYLLAPYFLWILFAGYLTLRIWLLN